MVSEGLILRGVQGVVSGHVFFVPLGFEGSLGRSRRCDVCMKDAAGFIALAEKKGEEEIHFKTTSRKHIILQVTDKKEVIIKDTSTNGTFVNSEKISEKTIHSDDILDDKYELRLGTTETFRLEWGENPDPDDDQNTIVDTLTVDGLGNLRPVTDEPDAEGAADSEEKTEG